MRNNYKAIIEGAPDLIEGYSIYKEAVKQMVDQRNALIADDWIKLESLASKGLGVVYGSYRHLIKNLGGMSSLMTETTNKFSCMLKKHVKENKNKEEFFSKIKKELLEKRPDIDSGIISGLNQLIDGKIQGNPLMNVLDEVAGDIEGINMENSAINSTVALAVRSIMSLTYAGFYKHYKAVSKQDFKKFGNEFFEKLITEVNNFEDELDICIKEIHNDLISKLSPVQSAELLISYVENNLSRFGKIQAAIRFFTETLKNEGKGTASEETGVLAVKAGDITRTAFAAYASAYYLALQSKMVEQDSKVKNLIKNADKIAYNTQFPNGRNTEISKTGQLKEDVFIEVSGFVQSIKRGRDNDGKLISQVTLYDPSSNATVIAAGIFVHLIHVGLTKDTYCNLSGKWKKESGLNWGNPAIEIDKLSINDLSKKSWKILFQDISDKFVERWPGGLNIAYGLSSHISGEGEGSSEILGAGELIFKPFIR